MNIKRTILLLIVAATAGCRLIDDDLSVCGTEYTINYQMNLVTEIQMEIDEQLSSVAEKPLADALKKWAGPIFSGEAHDLEMDFYSLDGSDELKHHFAEVINAKQKSYTLTIPREDYRHLAVVNVADNPSVSLEGTAYSSSMRLAQRNADTVESHATAVYSARLTMHMQQEGDLLFNVHLYMTNCAVALAVTDSTYSTKPVIQQVLLSGTATNFSVNDSVYTFAKPSVIRAEKVTNWCYAAVAFPSRDEIAASCPQRGVCRQATADDSLWALDAFVQLPNGTVTKTHLTIQRPLKASTLQIIRVYMQDDGSLVPVQKTEVGASVTLDWKEGTTQELITG